MELKDVCALEGDSVVVKDPQKLREAMDGLIYDAVFEADEEKRKAKFTIIKEACKAYGAVPASIQGLYEEMGRNYPGFTVPAINIRGSPMTVPGSSSGRPWNSGQGPSSSR